METLEAAQPKFRKPKTCFRRVQEFRGCDIRVYSLYFPYKHTRVCIILPEGKNWRINNCSIYFVMDLRHNPLASATWPLKLRFVPIAGVES